MHAMQEREKTIDAIRWAIVLLGALAAWECARSVNVAIQTKGLIHATDYLVQLDGLMGEAEASETFAERLNGSLASHADILIPALFLLGVTALVTRMLFACPLLDFLYLESEAQDRRGMLGFLVVVFGLLIQMGLIYSMVLFARPDEGVSWSGYVPLLMTAYLLGGAVWMLLLRIGIQRDDKRGLRGIWPAFGVNLVVGAGLGCLTWFLTADGPATATEFHQGNSLRNIGIAAVAALLACSLDTFFQGRLYGKTHGRTTTRTILTLVLLLALLGAGGYMLKVVWTV